MILAEKEAVESDTDGDQATAVETANCKASEILPKNTTPQHVCTIHVYRGESNHY